MNTINVSAEILRELGTMADNANYLEKVLAYIRNLNKKNTVSRGATYTALLEQLSDFQEYEEGWDGVDARPLSRKVVKNFKAVLVKASDEMLQGWHLEPQGNGTLLLLNDNRNAGINIGTTDYSFYVVNNGDVEGQNHLHFTVGNLLQTLKHISK